MTSERDIGIIGMGMRLPDSIRRNDDPIFDYLRKHHPDGQNLFTGYDRRHVLAEGEGVLDILAPAARMAIDDAGLTPDQIDLVMGTVSPSTFLLPSDLFALHNLLKLPQTTATLPIVNDFNNFNAALTLADTMVRAGRARNILIAIGGGWTRIMDYRSPQSISAADGAAAVVVGLAGKRQQPRWRYVDAEVVAEQQNFGEMYLIGDRRQAPTSYEVGSPSDPDPLGEDWTGPYFHITDAGLAAFSSFGAVTALLAVTRLLQRQGIPASDVTLTGHQASQKLIDAWQKAISPKSMFFTIADAGNMTVANIPVNLCLLQPQVKTPWVVALGLAPDMTANAILLKSPQ